jgi:cytochrome c-type biogenesis protein
MENLASILESYLYSSIFLSIVASFIAGLLTSFTPCVYPLIPITAAVISANNLGQKSKLKILYSNLFYIAGIAIVYTTLGIFAALTGKLFGQISTSFVFNFIIGFIMIFFGLNMFGLFTINLPIFFRNKIQSDRHSYLGLFLVGISAGFIFAPCTAPALGVLLAFISSTRNVLVGGLSMLFFSIGLTTLLVLVGTFSGFVSMLPKSGKWMVAIKKGLGIIMIGLGLYYIFLGGI